MTTRRVTKAGLEKELEAAKKLAETMKDSRDRAIAETARVKADLNSERDKSSKLGSELFHEQMKRSALEGKFELLDSMGLLPDFENDALRELASGMQDMSERVQLFNDRFNRRRD